MRDAEKLDEAIYWAEELSTHYTPCSNPDLLEQNILYARWFRELKQLRIDIQTQKDCLCNIYDWLKKNKMEYTAHGQLIAEVLKKE